MGVPSPVSLPLTWIQWPSFSLAASYFPKTQIRSQNLMWHLIINKCCYISSHSTSRYSTKGPGLGFVHVSSLTPCSLSAQRHLICDTWFIFTGVCSVAQSCPTLFDPMDRNPPGFSVHGISHARILDWVAIAFSRRSSQPRDLAHVSCVSHIGRRILYHYTTCKALDRLRTAQMSHISQLRLTWLRAFRILAVILPAIWP